MCSAGWLAQGPCASPACACSGPLAVELLDRQAWLALRRKPGPPSPPCSTPRAPAAWSLCWRRRCWYASRCPCSWYPPQTRCGPAASPRRAPSTAALVRMRPADGTPAHHVGTLAVQQKAVVARPTETLWVAGQSNPRFLLNPKGPTSPACPFESMTKLAEAGKLFARAQHPRWPARPVQRAWPTPAPAGWTPAAVAWAPSPPPPSSPRARQVAIGAGERGRHAVRTAHVPCGWHGTPACPLCCKTSSPIPQQLPRLACKHPGSITCHPDAVQPLARALTPFPGPARPARARSSRRGR